MCLSCRTMEKAHEHVTLSPVELCPSLPPSGPPVARGEGHRTQAVCGPSCFTHTGVLLSQPQAWRLWCLTTEFRSKLGPFPRVTKVHCPICCPGFVWKVESLRLCISVPLCASVPRKSVRPPFLSKQ